MKRREFISLLGGTGKNLRSAKINLSRWQPCRSRTMAAISGGRANDERVKCLLIFADGNGETRAGHQNR
jgi:hypothetical protein